MFLPTFSQHSKLTLAIPQFQQPEWGKLGASRFGSLQGDGLSRLVVCCSIACQTDAGRLVPAEFPGHLRIDYVRVYQKKGQKSITCDPKDYPTSEYINNHMDLYTKCVAPVFHAVRPHF